MTTETSTFHSGAIFANRYYIAAPSKTRNTTAGHGWSSADGLTWEIAVTGYARGVLMAANGNRPSRCHLKSSMLVPI